MIYKSYNIKFNIKQERARIYLMARTEEGRRCIAGFRYEPIFFNTNIIHIKYEYNIRTPLYTICRIYATYVSCKSK